MPQSPARFLPLVVAGALAAAPAAATTWSVEASVSDERTTEITSVQDGGGTESDTTETFEQSYSVSYETDLDTSLRLSIELGLDITDEIQEGPQPDTDFDTREIKPTVDAELQAEWWDLTGSWEETQTTSDDPAEPKSTDSTWDLELNADTGGDVLPSGKVKFQRDREEEDGRTQKVDDSLEASLDYTLWDLLELSFDAKKETTDDRVTPDSDTEDRDVKVDVSFDRELGDSVKVEAKWTNERKQSVTLTDDGDVLPPIEDTLDNSLQAKLTYNPLEDLELSLERQVDWKSDLEQADLEVEETWSGEASYGASLTESLDIDLSYSDERKETRGTDADEHSITRDYSASVDFSPVENVTLTPSWDRSAERRWPERDESEHNVDDTYEIKLDTAFWRDQLEFSVTRTFDQKKKNAKVDTEERNWDVDLSLSLEGLPNLELSPKYTFTHDRDLVAGKTDVERKIEVDFTYEVNLGDVVVLTLDHGYSRTSTDPGEGISTIKREDDTDVNLSWKDFLRGMTLEVDFTRKASDESGDDQGPEVDHTYSVTYDWEFLTNYTISFEYELDKKDQSEDTRSLQTTVSAEFLEGLLTVDFEHEFEEQLEGDTKDKHRYLIEVQGKF